MTVPFEVVCDRCGASTLAAEGKDPLGWSRLKTAPYGDDGPEGENDRCPDCSGEQRDDET